MHNLSIIMNKNRMFISYISTCIGDSLVGSKLASESALRSRTFALASTMPDVSMSHVFPSRVAIVPMLV